MRPQVLTEIIDELDTLDIDAAIKAKIEKIICSAGQRYGAKCTLMRERLTFVLHLLDRGENRGTIRVRLKAMHGISERQALRIICHALQIRHKSNENGAAT